MRLNRWLLGLLLTLLVSGIPLYGYVLSHPVFSHVPGLLPLTMHGRGTLPATTGAVWSIGMQNPATIMDLQRPAVAVNARSSPPVTTDPLVDVSAAWPTRRLPQSVMIAYPYWAAVLALSAHEWYALDAVIPASDDSDRLAYTDECWQYGVGVATAFAPNLLHNDTCSIGAQFNFIHYRSIMHTPTATYKLSPWNYTSQVGLRYRFSGKAGNIYRFGVVVTLPGLLDQSQWYHVNAVGDEVYYWVFGSFPGGLTLSGMLEWASGYTWSVSAQYQGWNLHGLPPAWGTETSRLRSAFGIPWRPTVQVMGGVELLLSHAFMAEDFPGGPGTDLLTLYSGAEWQRGQWRLQGLVGERHVLTRVLHPYLFVKMGVGYVWQ